MYLFGGLVGIVLVILAVLSRREEGKPLMKMAVYLYKRGCIYKIPLLNARHVQKDLESLHPGQSGMLLQGDYYIRKIRMLLVMLGVGTLLGVLTRAKTGME